MKEDRKSSTVRVALYFAKNGQSVTPFVILIVYATAVLEMLIRTPFLTGSLILWIFIAVFEWQNPSLIWIIVPIWLSFALPPTYMSLKIIRIAHEQGQEFQEKIDNM